MRRAGQSELPDALPAKEISAWLLLSLNPVSE